MKFSSNLEWLNKTVDKSPDVLQDFETIVGCALSGISNLQFSLDDRLYVSSENETIVFEPLSEIRDYLFVQKVTATVINTSSGQPKSRPYQTLGITADMEDLLDIKWTFGDHVVFNSIDELTEHHHTTLFNYGKQFAQFFETTIHLNSLNASNFYENVVFVSPLFSLRFFNRERLHEAVSKYM